MKNKPIMIENTAREMGLIACHFCHTLSKNPSNLPKNRQLRCPCCHSVLHSRIPNSLSQTTALLFAALFLYIPANILPIMTVIFQGVGEPDTIMGGVLHLLEGGMWPLALIVFIASIVVPVLKLVVLSGLLLSIRFRSKWNPVERTRLYRIMEFIGRWSMVDIFVIAILVALVQFGNTASIYPGLGALSFAAVVILTMLAAHTFDPRLIWDNLGKS
jgi:paraquat-inducible protein A